MAEPTTLPCLPEDRDAAAFIEREEFHLVALDALERGASAAVKRRTRKPTKIGERGYKRLASDLYRTPAWVTNILTDNVRLRGPIWEPACGLGDMVEPLRVAHRFIYGTDILDVSCWLPGIDFLAAAAAPNNDCQAIVTNPPFSLATEFVRHALHLMRPGAGMVAMLLSHDFDTALKTRGDLFRDHPAFVGKLTLGQRISWVGLEKKNSPRLIHAWFIWDWCHRGPALALYPK